jgi:glycosyltransferase involved in cell wall biosynthesis
VDSRAPLAYNGAVSVIHLSYASDGGASRAGRRAHLACTAAEIASEFAFVEGDPAMPSDIHLAVAPERAAGPAAALTDVLDRLQWGFVPKHRTTLTNTLLSLPYPGADLAQHPLLATADIVHLHWPTWAVTPRAIRGWLAGGRTVFWTLHDFWAMTGGCHYPAGCEQYQTECLKCPQLFGDIGLVPNAFAEKLHAYGAGGSLWIVTPSEFLAARARESRILGGRPVEIVRNPIELDRFRPPEDREALRQSWGVRPEDFVIFFGSFDLAETRKGAGLLVEAVRRLVASGELAAALPHGARIHLAVTGKSTALAGLPGVAMLDCGRLEEDETIADALGVADLACLPSLEDNYPNVAVEATACGTPCLGFAAGGIPEIIEDGQTGILVPAVGSVEGLKQGMLRFAAEHFGNPAMRAACRDAAEAANSPEKIGRHLKALYERALGRPLAGIDPALRRRAIRALGNAPVAPDLQPTGDFLRFPVNVATAGLARDRGSLAAIAAAGSSERQGGTRLVSVRTQHEHHSAHSGPYQFVRHLPRGRYDAAHYAVPLGGELTGAAQALYRRAGMLLGLPAFAQQANYWLAESEILIRCAREEVDLVHFIDGEHGGWLLPRLADVVYKNGHRPRFVATFHQPPEVLRSLINVRALAQFDGVIALCRSQRDFLAEYVAAEKLFTIPHGVDLDYFRPPRGDEFVAPDGKFHLLLVGHWLRDLDAAFAAVDRLEARGLHFELTIVSPEFPARRRSPHVRLLTGLPDDKLREVYWATDLLLMPLRDATANNAILEAMACGRPVISTAVGGVAEAVGCEAGILVPPGDPLALAEAVLRLAGDPTRRAEMGRAARRQAEKFGWPAIAEQHDIAYRQILDGRAPRPSGEIAHNPEG